MEKWKGKVAVVTGANSGIGLAVTRMLLDNQLVVVAIDKYVDTLKEIAASRPNNNNSDLNILNKDLRDDDEIRKSFDWLENTLGGPDILINCAGIAGRTPLLDGTADEWRQLVDVNVVGLALCTKEAVKLMKKKDIEVGQIINLSSNLTYHSPREGILHFYTATKHAVKSLTQGFQMELIGSSIKISSISPGLVKTGIFKASLGEAGDRAVYSTLPYLSPEDVASAVEYILSAPKHLQIAELNIKPLGSPV